MPVAHGHADKDMTFHRTMPSDTYSSFSPASRSDLNGQSTASPHMFPLDISSQLQKQDKHAPRNL